MSGYWRFGVAVAISACTVVGTMKGKGASADSANSMRPELSGTIKDEAGSPLGNATIFIYTAGPKEGSGILCPSCYADCRKSATSDKDGRFKIESLDPNLLFRVLVVAKGHRPEFVSKVDPALKPIEVALRRSKAAISQDQQIRGRVVNAQSQPVAGAVVSVRGVTRGQSTRFGGNDDIDPVAVSDDDGQFLISSEAKFDAVGVEVEARAYAKGVFQHLATGGKIHELKLSEGASVTGRLMKQGQPVTGAEMGICGVDRSAEIYVGDFSVGTDQKGRFLLVNLPPNRDYFLYATMNSLGEKGAMSARRVRVGEDGSVLDVGDIPLLEGFKLEGQIRLTDGKPVPAKTRVLLSREEAWDSSQAEADELGRFRFLGVPQETIGLSARLKGYQLSHRNKSLDVSNPFRLTGLLKGTKTDLVLEFEPGDGRDQGRGDFVDLRQEPLFGAEAAKERQGDIHVTGTVADAQTSEPLAEFVVTEGRTASFPQSTRWLTARQTKGTNGMFDLYLSKGGSAPAIMVEAEGHLPQSSGPITGTETNLSFALTRGDGPSGVVLRPYGEPAAGATVYMADMQNGVYLQDSSLKPDERMARGTRSTKTDSAGRFRFKARVDDYGILVMEDEGFAQVTVENLSRNAEVKLQPWAKIQGQLLIGTRLGTNETIRLNLAHLPYEYHPRSFAPLSLFLQTKTDNAGRFAFDRVPPISIQIYHSPKVRDDEMGTIPSSQTTSFSLRPGEVKSLTLGGKGRPVIGRLAVKGYEGTIDWRSDVHSLELILPPNEELPDLLVMLREQSAKVQAADTDEEKQRLIAQMEQSREEAMAKQRQFYATEKGRSYYFQNKRYALNFAEDGTFRVEDVPAGKYRLRIDLREGGGGPMNFSAPRIASLDKEIEVPDSPGGRSDGPFDLGRIELQAKTVLSVGKSAPDFEVKTVDEKPVKLSDYAGKYVLLDFWAVWCGPCVAETPHLKATYEALKDDPRFAMIGLSLDPNSKTPREYAKKNQLGWTMGFLGDWSKTDLPSRYGVEGIPSIFLIGPDGKVLAKDLRGTGIKAAVEKALAPTSSSLNSILQEDSLVASKQTTKTSPGNAESAPAKRVPEPKIDPQAARQVEPRVRELTKDWKDSKRLFETGDTWAEQVRALVQIGKPAVPTLTELLDRTKSESDLALRLLGFTLRAIGDARAVPALIQTIPKTLRPPGSDCGVHLEDPELLAFLQRYDLQDSPGGRDLSIGRPVREISAALEKITGVTHGEQELFHMFQEGGQAQLDLQRGFYFQVAHRWAEWWKTNWSSFVVDPALAEVRLPLFVCAQPGLSAFPSGPTAKVTDGHANVIIGAVEEPASECFLDLDTSRWLTWNAAATTLGEQDATREAACTWAAQQGIDLVGTKYTSSSSAKACSALRAVGLQAWEISNERWDTIAEELRSSEPLKLGQPARDMLMHHDSEKGCYIPERRATFLFITREGTPGILRVISQATWPRQGIKIEYKSFYREDH